MGRIDESAEEETGRSAARPLHHRSSWDEQASSRQQLPGLIIRRIKNVCGRRSGCRTVTRGTPERCPIATALAKAALTGRRFLHLGAHRAQVVRRRDYRKEDGQNTSQSQQALQRTESAGDFAVAPQPVGRERQQQPRKIKQQFHEEPITRAAAKARPLSPRS
jgi:hypothetical protein